MKKVFCFLFIHYCPHYVGYISSSQQYILDIVYIKKLISKTESMYNMGYVGLMSESHNQLNSHL